MNSFKINETEFGVGDAQISIEDNMINLKITADDEKFEALSDQDNWGWALYPPEMYFYEVPYIGAKIKIDDSMLDRCDIGLYMMEHCAFKGVLEIKDNAVIISGNVDIIGEISKVHIIIEDFDAFDSSD
ncbi:hypothetical protein [Campylobacter sp.]|uniref:hypothetical protein n=1 Tax=Campylobacter sp. TaxID=205 RepID=UPI0026F57590|nr:hypothetical protein [Campylobacter sp.]